ncbi:hypothetical protein K6V98_08580 [Collinsella sp. AGMB00827]|uniref:Uncharacterized protein n=1 Tax=Collinsella ureilytica TaxID=2869515 RepID=A0ABS7MM03_9ACTN|nr:hypothetical protein [Collinsella urealyticum]MBY4798399.1 hypothetical protein [Collinsella urealyticum]
MKAFRICSDFVMVMHVIKTDDNVYFCYEDIINGISSPEGREFVDGLIVDEKKEFLIEVDPHQMQRRTFITLSDFTSIAISTDISYNSSFAAFIRYYAFPAIQYEIHTTQVACAEVTAAQLEEAGESK